MMKDIVQYVSEAFVRGAVAGLPAPGSSINDIVGWIERHGIEVEEYNERNPYVRPKRVGEIVALKGPCDTPMHTWVFVSRMFKNHIVHKVLIKPDVDDSSFFDEGFKEHHVQLKDAIMIAQRLMDGEMVDFRDYSKNGN